MKQKYIDSVAYTVDDQLDQIFPHHKVPSDIQFLMVLKLIRKLMSEFESLMNEYEEG